MTVGVSLGQHHTPELVWGTVAAVQANFYRVVLEADPGDVGMIARPNACAQTPQGQPEATGGRESPGLEPLTLLCTRRARLKKTGQQVAVGDRVGVAEPDWQGGRGAIAEVAPRRSWLDRPPIANVDHIALVFALAEPALDPLQLTRFLLKAESTGLAVSLILNKSDLVSEPERRAWGDRLHEWGYTPIFTRLSAPQTPAPEPAPETGLDELERRLVGQTTIIAGPSGAGKSSAIAALIPTAAPRLGAVSGKLARGRHTTRHVELFPLPGGGLLADSPGFNQPSLDLLPTELAELFPEIRQRLAELPPCHYADCWHREEPGCSVRGDWARYGIYLRLLAEAEIYGDRQHQTRTADPHFKRKAGREGEIRWEPRLLAKKYRRSSRRSQHQLALDSQEEAEETAGE